MGCVRQNSGITIMEARIRNFRTLKSVDVHLDKSLTVLIGGNDSGKTSFLEALNSAIGVGRKNVAEEDVYLAPSEIKLPRDRTILIDLLIRPTDCKGSVIDTFPQVSSWLELWGSGIAQDEKDNDFVGIRTLVRWDPVRGEYSVERKFLSDWPEDSHAIEQARTKANSISSSQLEPLALYLLDAKRDMQDELQGRNSFWGKLVSDPGLDESLTEELESSLTQLNEQIISGSAVLAHIHGNLDELCRTLGGSKISILPLARHLRDLSKGMDVSFATKGAQSFPLTRHGMGTRSVAAVLTFRAYMTWRLEKLSTTSTHPVLGLEEPESHLHPQAQQAIFGQVQAIPGQKIVSTHSPYIVSQAEIGQFRHFKKVNGDTRVTQFDAQSLSEDDLRKIRRMVLNTRGELLFTKALVVFEGETEEQALPVFAQHYWKQHPSETGISLISVNGAGNYFPFIKLAESFSIPWFILSDGEPAAINNLSSALEKVGVHDYQQCPDVVVLPGGSNFEAYLVLVEGYDEVLSAMFDEHYKKSDYVTDYATRLQGSPRKGGDKRDYDVPNGRRQAIVDILSENKTVFGSSTAEHIVAAEDEARKLPTKIRTLFDRISSRLDQH